MKSNCLIAEFKSERDFRIAIEVLEKAHFSADEVSLVTHADDDALTELDVAKDPLSESPPTAKTTATTTVAGGALGAALGTMTLMGPLLVAGPIFGMAAGAVGGGILSNIHRWGVDQDVAEAYESKVQNGSRLVIVTGDDDIRLADARRALKTTGPTSLEILPRS